MKETTIESEDGTATGIDVPQRDYVLCDDVHGDLKSTKNMSVESSTSDATKSSVLDPTLIVNKTLKRTAGTAAAPPAGKATRSSKRLKAGQNVQQEVEQDPVQHLRKGCAVELLVGVDVVGTACCHVSVEGEASFSRSLHRTELSKVECAGEHLIVIRKISIEPEKSTLPFRYACPGPEDPPMALSDMYYSGFYTWDSRKLRMTLK